MAKPPKNLKDHCFKPGQSGNPRGRPKGKTVTERLQKIINENEGEIADALVKTALKHALKGDHRFFKEILDRVEGKVADRVQHSGAEGGPMIVELIKGKPPESEADDAG